MKVPKGLKALLLLLQTIYGLKQAARALA